MKSIIYKSFLGLGIVLAAFWLATCEQPVALGQKVDLTAPVLTIVINDGSLEPGEFIQGTGKIRVSAKDDSGIESVTITYEYRYVLTQEDVDTGEYPEKNAGDIIDRTMTVNANEYGDDIYGFDINSLDPDELIADGEVKVRITAKDGSGKEGVLANQTYTVKNSPPSIELNIPKLALSGESRLNPIDMPLSMVTTGGFISGSASDALAGVAPGYPKIQFWTTSTNLAGQGIPAAEPDPDNENDWIPVDSPKTWNSNGEKAMEFRYYLEARDADGGRFSPTVVLLPGTYYLRVKVQDILGHEQIWPPKEEGYVPGTAGTSGWYYDDKATIEVQAAGTPPVITITPLANQYQNKDFTLQASAVHTIDVAEMTWAVADPDFPTDAEKRITVKKQTGDSIAMGFKPNTEYTDINDAAKKVTLTDGVWTFYAGALSADNTPGDRSYDVYIDTEPPVVGITNVSPFVADNILASPPSNQFEHEYTVNGIITVSADAPYDTMKNGAESNGDRSRRYIVLKGSGAGFANFPTELNEGNIESLPDPAAYLYDGYTGPNTGFFDRGPTGNIAIASKTNNIVINTTTLYMDSDYWLYVFVIDKDAAGNASFAYASIHVDQETDKPRVVFSDPKTGDITELKYLTDEGEPGEYASSILDANARINISLEDDDKIDGGGTMLRVWDSSSGVTPSSLSYTLETASSSIVSYTISRQDLARAFTGNAAAAADAIPEGTYYFDIQTKDTKTGGSQEALAAAASELYGPWLFAIDTDFPRIGIDEGIRGAYQSASFTLGAYAQDNSGIKEITITQPTGSSGTVNDVTDGGNGRVNFTHTISGIDTTHLTFTITAKDTFNKTTTETVEVKYDILPPKVEITNPVDPLDAVVVSSWVQGNIADFRGSGTDWNNTEETEEGSSFKYVYYWIDTTGQIDASGAQHDDSGAANYFPPLPVNEDTYEGWTKRITPTKNDWQIYHTIRGEDMLSTVGDDGIKAIYVIAIDNAGNWSDTGYNTIAGGKFGVDQIFPILPTPTAGSGANQVGSSLYAKGPFSFTFPARDGNQLALEASRVSITRTKNKDSATLTTIPISTTGNTKVTFTETTANKDYTYTLNESVALSDGVYDYVVTVTDAAGHQSSASFTLTVDTTPPTVNITRYQSTITRSDLEGQSYEYVNDFIRINVTAADAGSGVGVDDKGTEDPLDDRPMAKWWFLDPGEAEPTWAADGGIQFAATPLEAVIDTKDITDTSNRKFYTIVRDNAGNESHIALTDGNKNKIVRVHQGSDKPVINITYPLPDGFGDQNLEIQAAFSDDDGFAAGALQYRFLPDSGLSWPGDDNPGWKPLEHQNVPANTSVPELNMTPLSMEDIFTAYKSSGQNWNTPADRAAVLGAEEKPKAIQIRAVDSSINKVPGPDGTSPDVASIKELTFTLDYTPPGVDPGFKAKANPIDDPTPGASIELAGSTWSTSFSVSGTFTERNIQTINVTVGGLSSAIDPSVHAVFPATGGSIYGSGENWTWYYNLDTVLLGGNSIWDSLNEGPHSAQIVITDQVGGTAQHTVSFYKDTAPPKVSFSNLSEEWTVPIKLLREAEDHNYSTGKDGGAYDDLTVADVAGLDGFTPPADWNDKEAVHTAARTYYQAARDVLDDSIIQGTDPLRGVFADEYSAVGGGGVNAFEYRFDTDPIDEAYPDDPAYTLWRPGTNGLLGAAGSKSTSWSIPMPAADENGSGWSVSKQYPLADGFHTVTIRVKDALGNEAVTKDIAFFLDREAPEITLDGDFLTAFPPNATIGLDGVADGENVFVIKGTAGDANLKAILPGNPNSGMRISLPGYTGISFTQTVYDNSTGKWTWSAAVPKAAFTGLSEDGAKTITVTATDLASRETPRTWTFIKDTEAPANSFLNLDAGTNTNTAPAYFPNASDKILGVTNDAVSYISALTYTIDKKGIDWAEGNFTTEKTDEDLLGASPGSASKNWSIVLGPAADGGIELTDGEYRLKVRASDSAKGKAPGLLPNSVDNDGKDWIYFIVDRNPPVLNLTAPAGANTYFNGPITFTGTASDPGGSMDKVVLSIRNQPGIAPVGIPAAGFTGDQWSGVVDPTALPSGTYTINIAAWDKAGHQTTMTKDIIFDNNPPVFGNISPALDTDGTRVIGRTTITGTSTDAGGSVARIYYQIGKQETETGTVVVTAMTPDGVYTIAGLGDTTTEQWKAAGAKEGTAGEIFIAKAAGLGTGTVLPWKDSKLDNSAALPWTDAEYPTPVKFDRGLAIFTIEIEKSDLFVTTNNTDYDNGLIWGSKRWEYTNTTGDELTEDDGTINTGDRTLVATLPIRLLAQDLAGNLGVYDYRLRVDTHMDRAHTDINNPGFNAVVGGEVRLSGAANDNNNINSVWVRVTGADHGAAGVNDDWLSWTDWDDDTDEWWDWSKTTEPPDTKDDTKQLILNGGSWGDSYGWHRATLTNNGAGVSNWYINLNSNGKLTPPAGNTERRVYIQVFTRDTKSLDSSIEDGSINGYITQYILIFSDTVPVVEQVMVERQDGSGNVITTDPYTPQMQISKTVKITAEVKDGEGLQFLEIQKSGQSQKTDYLGKTAVDGITVAPKTVISNGGALTAGTKYLVTVAGDYTAWGGASDQNVNSYFTASANDTYTGSSPLYEADAENNFVYTLEMELDTAALFNNATGLYDIQITATDNSERHLYTLYSINLQIDNYYPRGAYTGLPEVIGIYDIRGSATDVPTGGGSVQGLKSVTVYFSRMENGVPVYYTAEGTRNTGLLFTTIKAKTWDGSNLSTNPEDIPYPVLGTNSKPGFENHPKGGGVVIDHDESRFGEGDDDTSADGDGYSEDWHDEGVNKIWGARYDSEGLKDGKITIHYVIEDMAGNRTHQSAEIFVKNYAPKLFSLSLGTAVYDTGDASRPMQTQEIPSSRYSGSGFIARNDRLEISATLLQDTGNNANYYRVSYVERTGTDNKVEKGKLYTIASASQLSIFTAVGAPDSSQGTSFIATTTSGLGGGSVYTYNEAAYTSIKAGDPLASGTTYVVDFSGDTNWQTLGAATAHPGSGTVFTSNGTSIPANTTGTAYAESELKVKTGVFPGNGSGNAIIDVVFDAASFGAAPKIPDSETVSGDDRFFLIKVYDTTGTMDTAAPFAYSAGAAEDDQLFDIILAGLRIENEDKNRPVTRLYDFNPKAETSRITGTRLISGSTITNPLQGGLFMEDGKISGHIEPRSPGLSANGPKPANGNTSAWLELVNPDDDPGLPATEFKFAGFSQDTLAGKVIIRGYAKDDQRIAAIWLKLGTAPAEKILDTITNLADAQKVSATVTNATLGEYLGRLKPAGTHTGPVGADPDVGVHDSLNLSGHEVYWAYVWDTSVVPAGVVGDVTVEVIAEDKARGSGDGTPSTGSDVPGASITASNGTGTANVDYNTITVGRAPYISTLTRFKNSTGQTDADKAVELRSRNGWYSFRRGNGDTEGLRVDGFNLKGGNDSTFNIEGTGITTGITSISASQQYFLVPAAAKSGVLTVSASSGTPVAAVNNRNNNDNSWNQESLAGNAASARWTDDRYVHLFDSHNIETGNDRGLFNKATGQATAKPIYPAMAINPAYGTLFASFSSTVLDSGTAYMPVFYSSNGATNATTIFRHSDPSEWTDISFNYNTGGTIPTVIYMGNVYLTDYSIGGLFAYDYNIATKTFAANNTATAAMSGVLSGNNITYRYYNIERFADTNSGELYIWQNPRIVTSRSGTNTMYASYYDNRRGQLHYWSRATVAGNNNSNGGNNSRTWPQVIDGNTSAYTTNANITNTAGGTKSPVAGEYSAIDLTSANVPIIVYQSKDASGVESVKYAYPDRQDRTQPTGNQWTVASIPGTTNGGRYISMRIDNTRTSVTDITNDIHITYMDGDNGDLVYVHGKLTNSGAAQSCAYTFDDPLVIDSVGNVGKWTDLTLDQDGSPYISYLDQGGIDSRTGLKMAFYDPAVSTAADQNPGTDDSGWEYVTLPGRYVVNDVRTQIEYDTRPARTWNAALAYVSGNDYRISYYVKE